MTAASAAWSAERVGLYRDQGVVLRSIRLGEADRIVTLATAGHGKVRAVAKGVRKTKSRFGGRLEPVGHVACLFYEGRELDIVTQADTLDHFRAVRDDLERVSRATAMLEAVDQVVQEREANYRVYQMLVGALRALADAPSGTVVSPLIVPAFFLKLLAVEGVAPLLDQCAACGAPAAAVPGGLVAFDLGQGGGLCRSCRRGVAVSAEAFGLLRLILGGGLNAALREPAGPATWEVEHLAAQALEYHLERRLRSLHILDH